MPVRRVPTKQAAEKHHAATGDNIERKKCISEDGGEKSNGEGDE